MSPFYFFTCKRRRNSMKLKMYLILINHIRVAQNKKSVNGGRIFLAYFKGIIYFLSISISRLW